MASPLSATTILSSRAGCGRRSRASSSLARKGASSSILRVRFDLLCLDGELVLPDAQYARDPWGRPAVASVRTGRKTGRVGGSQHVCDLAPRPQITVAFLAFGLGVFGGVEATVGSRHASGKITGQIGGHRTRERLTGDREVIGVDPDELGIVR